MSNCSCSHQRTYYQMTNQGAQILRCLALLPSPRASLLSRHHGVFRSSCGGNNRVHLVILLLPFSAFPKWRVWFSSIFRLAVALFGLRWRFARWHDFFRESGLRTIESTLQKPTQAILVGLQFVFIEASPSLIFWSEIANTRSFWSMWRRHM
jgi:hypothetical protein